MRKSIVFVLLALVLIVSLIAGACAKPAPAPAPTPAPAPAPAPAPEPIVWIVNSNFPSDGIVPSEIKHFKEAVESRSNGRLVMELFWSGALGYDKVDALNTFKENLVDINEISSNNKGDEPMTSIATLPFLFDDAIKLSYWEENELLPLLNANLEKNWNSRILLKQPNYPTIVFYSREPIRTAEDFEGRTCRCWAGITDIIETIGMEPMVIDMADLYTALQRGMVDNAITSIMSGVMVNIWEVLPYVNKISLYKGQEWLGINVESFNALPKDLQDIVLISAEDASNWFAYNSPLIDIGQQMLLVENGMEMIEPEPGTVDDLRAKCRSLYQRYADEAGTPEVTKLLKDLGAIN